MVLRRELAKRLDDERRGKFSSVSVSFAPEGTGLERRGGEERDQQQQQQQLEGGKENLAPSQPGKTLQLTRSLSGKGQAACFVPAGGGDVADRPSYKATPQQQYASPPPPSPRPCVPRLSKVVIQSRDHTVNTSASSHNSKGELITAQSGEIVLTVPI